MVLASLWATIAGHVGAAVSPHAAVVSNARGRSSFANLCTSSYAWEGGDELSTHAECSQYWVLIVQMWVCPELPHLFEPSAVAPMHFLELFIIVSGLLMATFLGAEIESPAPTSRGCPCACSRTSRQSASSPKHSITVQIERV
jgi:hypothetical protein